MRAGRKLSDAQMAQMRKEAEQSSELALIDGVEGAAIAMHRALNSGVSLPEGDKPNESFLSWETEPDAIRAWYRRAAHAVIVYLSGVAE